MPQTKTELLERHNYVHPDLVGPDYHAEAGTAEPPRKEHLLKDAEIVFAFLAKVLEKLDDIYQTQVEQGFTIDFYGDNAGTGSGSSIIGTQNQGLYRTYNGPFIITSILATWTITGVTAVTLQLGDRTLQLLPGPGFFNPQALEIEMQRDDQIILTVTPPAACHLEIMGNVKKRVRETTN